MAKDAYENEEFPLQDEKKLKEPLLFANACGAISVTGEVLSLHYPQKMQSSKFYALAHCLRRFIQVMVMQLMLAWYTSSSTSAITMS
jgi:hypothetical protein